MSDKLTAKELYRRLCTAYGTKMSTAVIPEASVGLMAYEVDHYGDASGVGVRRIDALVLFRDKRWAIEIKVSKSDLVKELSEPEKAASWARYADCFYFFVTPELVDYAKEHVPPQYGIMSTNVAKTWKRYDGSTWNHIDSGITIVRRAKKNSAVQPIPNSTIRRMAMSYMKLAFKYEILKESHQRVTGRSLAKIQSPWGDL